MGYEETRFIGDIDQEFMCPICKMILEDAIQSPCEHLFCKQCIMPWLAADRSCPVDRRTLEVADLKPVARFFQNVLAKLIIKCDFEQQGCDKVVELEELQSHLLECTRNPNAEIVCDKGCNMTIRRHEYEMNDCLTHVSSRLAERGLENARLTALANCLQEKNQHMNDELNRQREENRRTNDANRRLQKENQHMNDELKRQREENRLTNVDNRRLQEENQHMSGELYRQRKENRQTNDANRRLQKENQHMNDELNRQREENRQAYDANRRLQEDNQHMNDELNLQREENRQINVDNRQLQQENQRMSDKLNRQREENRLINDRRLKLQIKYTLLKWCRSENVTFTGDACDILEVVNKNLEGVANQTVPEIGLPTGLAIGLASGLALSLATGIVSASQIVSANPTVFPKPTDFANPTGFANGTGFAQLFYSLESNFFFGVQILDWHSDSWMVIGLTRKHYTSYNPPGWSENSIGYSSYGTIQIDSKSEKVGASWKNGNTIHCGIEISENSDSETDNFDVVFLQNGKRIVEKRIEMPSDGLYPTICMWNCKVRYLTQ